MDKKPVIVFISNFLNHHQVEFCDAMAKNPAISFYFVAFEKLPEEKKRVGYADLSDRDYFLPYYDLTAKEKIHSIVGKADVLIGPPANPFFNVCKKDSIIFIFSEHIFKSSPFWHPKNLLRLIKYRLFSAKQKRLHHRTYILCASCRARHDYLICGFKWVDGFVKWGYFPKISSLAKKDKPKSYTDDCYTLLWVNRMLSWKHPEKALYILKTMIEQGVNCKLKFVGDGEKKERMMKKTKKMGLENEVEYLGFMPNEDVLKMMDRAHFVLSTSDRGEGWGATVNEGMSFGCIPIVYKDVGCSGFLIDSSNGIIYSKVRKITIPDQNMLKKMSLSAKEKILLSWNGEKAAENLVGFIKDIITNQKSCVKNCDMPGTLYGE